MTDCIVFIRILCQRTYSEEGAHVEQVVYRLIDDIFWNMGFKTETLEDRSVSLRRRTGRSQFHPLRRRSQFHCDVTVTQG